MHSIFTVRIRVLTTVKNQNFLLDSLKDALETPRRWDASNKGGTE